MQHHHAKYPNKCQVSKQIPRATRLPKQIPRATRPPTSPPAHQHEHRCTSTAARKPYLPQDRAPVEHIPGLEHIGLDATDELSVDRLKQLHQRSEVRSEPRAHSGAFPHACRSGLRGSLVGAPWRRHLCNQRCPMWRQRRATCYLLLTTCSLITYCWPPAQLAMLAWRRCRYPPPARSQPP